MTLLGGAGPAGCTAPLRRTRSGTGLLEAVAKETQHADQRHLTSTSTHTLADTVQRAYGPRTANRRD